jgi:CubicO group peptidase (beta-lactamase class C family)
LPGRAEPAPDRALLLARFRFEAAMRAHRRALYVALLFILALVRPLAAQEPAPTPDPTPAAELRLDAAELEPFFDGYLQAFLNQNQIPGAVISVVQDERIVFAKGYGFADLHAARPMDAAQTLVRPGSISKLMTWTAVLQLAEAGQLDLEADVNRYLDFEIPGTFNRPITMLDLMAHTAGFEDSVLGLITYNASDLEPLGQLVSNVPERIRPPGEVAAYSNYGVALAAYIVERVAGQPFDQVVAERIFAPLGMQRSTMVQPPPEPLAADLATGYLVQGGIVLSRTFEYVPLAPAGSMSTTAADMARFMLAHLNQGEFEGARILAPESVATMQSTHFRHDARLPGMAHGWMEREQDGVRMLTHGGDTILAHSMLALLPDQRVGIFVSFNGSSAQAKQAGVIDAFVERYILGAETQGPLQPDPTATVDDRMARAAVGSYLPTRINLSTHEKLLAFFQGMRVNTTEISGQIRATLMGLPPITANDAGDGYFVAQGPPTFVGNLLYLPATGTVPARMAASDFPAMAYEKQPWYGSLGLHQTLFLVSLFGMVTVLVGGVGAIVNRRTGRLERTMGRELANWSAGLFALLALIFVAVRLSTLSNPELITGLPAWSNLLFWVPWALLGLGAAMALFAISAWVLGWWSLFRRLYYTLITLLAGVLLALLAYWNQFA